MKPSLIADVLDIAFRARKQGKKFNPLFVGPPGVGKSEIVQAYAKKNNLPFVDLRIAYFEGPDMVGFPQVVDRNGRAVTTHATPDFWPEGGRGILLLEEPNRGTTSVMNTLMQILTDRKVGAYTLPEDWIIVGCVNPDGSSYDTNTMDSALKNRFAIFEVDYDRKSFTEFMEANKWSASIQAFVNSGSWTFTPPEQLKGDNAVYVSPRTWAQVEAAESAGIPEALRLTVYTSVLGSYIGKAYYQFACEDAPVTLSELRAAKTRKAALVKLKRHSDPNKFQGDKISVTVSDILHSVQDDAHKADDKKKLLQDDLLIEICKAMPADAGFGMLKELAFILKASLRGQPLYERLFAKDATLRDMYKEVLIDE